MQRYFFIALKSNKVAIKDNFYDYEAITINRTVVQLIAHFRILWIGHKRD